MKPMSEFMLTPEKRQSQNQVEHPTVKWDSLPPDIQERVLTAVANDRPYLNAVQNSDAQNAGIELDAALQRAIRDTLVGLIRENPPASAALSETAAQLKTDRELRDRLAAQVSAMARGLTESYTPEERDRIDANEPVPDLSASGLADDVARQAYTIIREAHELAREGDVLSSTARQRLPEDKRHTKPRYNKAERERGASIEAAFERIATEYDALAKRHGITDEQRAIIADLSNPIGKHLDDEEARQVFRHNWGFAAAVKGEEEAFRVAQWAVDNWRERGGNEGLRKEEAGRQRVKDERRAVSEQKLAWIREKLASGESVHFVTAMYGGAAGINMAGPTAAPALMAQWDAAGQDLLRIGPEGDLMMATGGSGRYVSQSWSALVASDGQTYNADGGMGQVRHYKADPEEFRGQYKVATPAVNRALKTLRVAKTREQFGAAIDAAGGVIRHDTDADRQAAGQEIYGGRRVFVQLDPDNPGSIINAIWWGDGDPVEATRLWAGRSGPHQYVEDVSGDGVFAGWHKPANQTATDSAPPPPSSTLAASDGQRFSESEVETRLVGRDSVRDGIPVQVVERVPVSHSRHWSNLESDMLHDRSLPDSDRRKINSFVDVMRHQLAVDDPDYIDPAIVKAMSNAERLKVAQEFMERRARTEPPPLAESWSGTANAEPPAVRLWVGRALTQGGIPVVLTERAAEPGGEVQFVLSGQDLYQDLGGVYTSVVPLQDVKPAGARLLTAQDAEVLLLDKSPVLVAPGVIPVGAPIKFPTGEKVNYGHVQGGPKDRRTFRIEKPRRSSKARAGRIAAAR